jgi:hypothetical protein
MNSHPPTPPDWEKALQIMFRHLLDMATQVSAGISEDEVEDRLRRVLRRSGHTPPAVPDGEPPTVPDGERQARALAAAAAAAAREELVNIDAIHIGDGCLPAETRIRQAERLLAGARREAAALKAEGQRLAAQASRERADARAALEQATQMLADARQFMDEALSYKDAALEQAAAIVADAKANAENIIQGARASHAHGVGLSHLPLRPTPGRVLLFAVTTHAHDAAQQHRDFLARVDAEKYVFEGQRRRGPAVKVADLTRPTESWSSPWGIAGPVLFDVMAAIELLDFPRPLRHVRAVMYCSGVFGATGFPSSPNSVLVSEHNKISPLRTPGPRALW